MGYKISSFVCPIKQVKDCTSYKWLPLIKNVWHLIFIFQLSQNKFTMCWRQGPEPPFPFHLPHWNNHPLFWTPNLLLILKNLSSPLPFLVTPTKDWFTLTPTAFTAYFSISCSPSLYFQNHDQYGWYLY